MFSYLFCSGVDELEKRLAALRNPWAACNLNCQYCPFWVDYCCFSMLIEFPKDVHSSINTLGRSSTSYCSFLFLFRCIWKIVLWSTCESIKFLLTFNAYVSAHSRLSVRRKIETQLLMCRLTPFLCIFNCNNFSGVLLFRMTEAILLAWIDTIGRVYIVKISFLLCNLITYLLEFRRIVQPEKDA